MSDASIFSTNMQRQMHIKAKIQNKNKNKQYINFEHGGIWHLYAGRHDHKLALLLLPIMQVNKLVPWPVCGPIKTLLEALSGFI